MGNTTNNEEANLVIYGNGVISAKGLSEQTRIGLTLLGGNKNLVSGTVIQCSDTSETDEDTLLSIFYSDHKSYGLKYKGGRLVLSEQNAVLMIGACIIVLVLVVTAVTAFVFCSKKKRRS